MISIPDGEHGLPGVDRQLIDQTYRAAIEFIKQHVDGR
jgi:hypothetical protein